MSSSITALFMGPAAASRAMEELMQRGITEKEISILASDRIDKEAFAVEAKTKVAEGTAIGATAGGVIGAVVAGLTAVGTIATGGAGLLVAGPIVAAFAGAGAGAATGAGLGALAGLAIPEHEVKLYEDALEKGSVLVGVKCKDSECESWVKEVFKKGGATKISSI